MTPQFITSMLHGHQHWSNLDHKYSVSVQQTVQGKLMHAWDSYSLETPHGLKYLFQLSFPVVKQK